MSDDLRETGFALILNVDQCPNRETGEIATYITDRGIPRPFLRDVAGWLGIGPAEWIDDADAVRLLNAVGGPIGPRETAAYERIIGDGRQRP